MDIYKLNLKTMKVDKLKMKCNIYDCNIEDNNNYTFYIIDETNKYLTIAYTKNNKILLTDKSKDLNIQTTHNILYINHKFYKIGLAFKVYVNELTENYRYTIIKDFLDSLKLLLDNYTNLIIYGIIDCIPNEKLQNILNIVDNRIKLYYLNNNYGIAYTTNIGIELLLEQNCDYIFCSDDDIKILDKDVLNVYIKNSIKYNKQHLGYFNSKLLNKKYTNLIEITNINNDLRKIKNMKSGCFYLITNKIIKKKGYLPIFNNKYGYEHDIFTKILSNDQYDLIDSDKYLILNDKSIKYCSGAKLLPFNRNTKTDVRYNLESYKHPTYYRDMYNI